MFQLVGDQRANRGNGVQDPTSLIQIREVHPGQIRDLHGPAVTNHDALVRDALDLMKQMRGDDYAVPLVPVGAKRFGQGGYAIGCVLASWRPLCERCFSAV